jgi:HAD superfamily hydrolase (TIGR01549 family)
VDKQKNIKAVIFDFDSTLVHLNINADNVRSKLTAYFTDFELDIYIRPVFPKIFEALKILSERYSKKEIDKIRRDAYKLIEEEEMEALEKAAPEKDAKKVLTDLNNRNIKVSVISVNSDRVVRETFQKFPRPDLLITRESLGVVKPDQRVGKYALKKLNLKPSEVLFVGDSDYDIDLARSLGIKSLLLKSNKQLTYTKPDVILEKLNDILKFI